MKKSGTDPEISQLLKRAAGRIKWLDFGRGFAMAGAFLFLFMLFAVVADHAIGLGRTVRILLAACFYVSLLVALFFVIFRPFARSVSDYYAAHKIEQSYPEYKSTLISYVELSRSDRPGWLSRSIARRFKNTRRTPNLDKTIRYRDFMLAAYAMAAMIVIFSVYCILSEKSVSRALSRVFKPWREISRATVTTVENVEPGDVSVAEGSSLEVTARIKGVFPKNILLEWVGSDGLDSSTVMDRVGDDPRRWRAILRDIGDPLTYRVRAGDGRSQDFKVDTFPVLTLEEVTVKCEFPAYTRLEPVLKKGPKISAVVGSKLFVECLFNNKLKKADGLVGSLNAPVRLDMWKVSFEHKITSTTNYFLTCVDENDQRLVPKVLHIEALEDKEPIVRVKKLEPVSEVAQWPGAIPIEFEVADDFGVDKTIVEYNVDGIVGKSRLIRHPPFPRSFSGRYLLDLGDMGLVSESILRFRLAVYDTHQPEPNRSETDWFMFERIAGAKPNKARDKAAKKAGSPEFINDVKAEREMRAAREDLDKFAKAEKEQIDKLKEALEKLNKQKEAQDSGDARDKSEDNDKSGDAREEPGEEAKTGDAEKPEKGDTRAVDDSEKNTGQPDGGREGKESAASRDDADEKRDAGQPSGKDKQGQQGDKESKGGELAQDSDKTEEGRKEESDSAADGKEPGGGEKQTGEPGQQSGESDKSGEPSGDGKPSGDQGEKAKSGDESAQGEGKDGKSDSGGASGEQSKQQGQKESSGKACEKQGASSASNGKGGKPGESEGKSGKEGTEGKGAQPGKNGAQAQKSGQSGSKQGQSPKDAKSGGPKAEPGGSGQKAKDGAKSGKSAKGKKSSADGKSGRQDMQSQTGSQSEAKGGESGQSSSGKPGKKSPGDGRSPAGARNVAEGNRTGADAVGASSGEEAPLTDPWENAPVDEKLKAHGRLLHQLNEALKDPKKAQQVAEDLGWTLAELRSFVDKYELPLKKIEKARGKLLNHFDEVNARQGRKAIAHKGGGFDASAGEAAKHDARKMPKDKIDKLAGDEGELLSPEYRDAVTGYFKRLAEESKK